MKRVLLILLVAAPALAQPWYDAYNRGVAAVRAKSYAAGDITTERVPQVDSDMIIDVRQRGARTGDVIGGRYVVEGQLGRGGMGRVLRVRHQALGKQ